MFWALVPITALNLVWQWISLPSMPPMASNPVSKLLGLLKRRNVAFAMLAEVLTFAGAFATFTYFRPFLETYTHVNVMQLSLLLLALGAAGFIGTYGTSALLGHHLYSLLMVLPLVLGVVTLGLFGVRYEMWGVAVAMIVRGAVNSAIPVAWSTWLTKGIGDEPESGGGLMVGAIQLSIMLGAAFGGLLPDHISLGSTFIAGALLLLTGTIVIGKGNRLMPGAAIGDDPEAGLSCEGAYD